MASQETLVMLIFRIFEDDEAAYGVDEEVFGVGNVVDGVGEFSVVADHMFEFCDFEFLFLIAFHFGIQIKEVTEIKFLNVFSKRQGSYLPKNFSALLILP